MRATATAPSNDVMRPKVVNTCCVAKNRGMAETLRPKRALMCAWTKTPLKNPPNAGNYIFAQLSREEMAWHVVETGGK